MAYISNPKTWHPSITVERIEEAVLERISSLDNSSLGVVLSGWNFCKKLEELTMYRGYKIEPGANLYRAQLQKASLHGADLSGADLRGADLSEADLHVANLSNARLYGADLTGANLQGANLSGADFTGAILKETSLHSAGLAEAYGIIAFGPVGQYGRIGYAVLGRNGKRSGIRGVRIQLGCFWGSLAEARTAIVEKYGKNSYYSEGEALVVAAAHSLVHCKREKPSEKQL